ncbi:MAG: hypothetical protein E7582_01865 [Ruminococcaceae bacterium]|nr:hypothetical protein [Oscillospiraceae bacterium]
MKTRKPYHQVIERFCANLGRNAILLRSVTSEGEEYKCLCSEDCKKRKDCSFESKTNKKTPEG